MTQIIFYLFAALATFSALMVITQNNPVRCVLFLVLSFFACSVLWVLAQAEFLALILVLVYVGAVMTLFLFVVMMLDIDNESLKKHMMKYLPIGLLLVAFFIALLLKAIPKSSFHMTAQQAAEVVSNTEALGLVLYTDYILAFELAAILLLVAIVAAITLAHRKKRQGKSQYITQQIMTRREDRLSVLSMKSETNK